MKKLYAFSFPAVCLAGYFAVCTGLNCYDWLANQYSLLRYELIANAIDHDLGGTDFSIDEKGLVEKPGSELSPDQLKRALWVMARKYQDRDRALRDLANFYREYQQAEVIE